MGIALSYAGNSYKHRRNRYGTLRLWQVHHTNAGLFSPRCGGSLPLGRPGEQITNFSIAGS
jgi:hypothetical protein